MNVFQYRDLVIEISKYLRYQDLIRFRSVNKTLYQHSKDGRYITLINKVRRKGTAVCFLIENAQKLGCSSYQFINCAQCGVEIIYCTDMSQHFYQRPTCVCVGCGEGVCNLCSFGRTMLDNNTTPAKCSEKCYRSWLAKRDKILNLFKPK